jgi:hypothetical protein
LEEDLNNIRSQIFNLLKAQLSGNWWDDLIIPSDLESGLRRGVNDLNVSLHLLEKLRVLRNVPSLVDIVVGATNNFIILGPTQLPAQTTVATGLITLGTVAAPHTGVFGTHSMDIVAGNSAIDPFNLVYIVDGQSRKSLDTSGNTVYGLLQSESGLDGSTASSNTPDRLQVSFVRLNPTGDGYEEVPYADVRGEAINYVTRERIRLQDLEESDFTGAPPSSTSTSSTGSQFLPAADLVSDVDPIYFYFGWDDVNATWLVRRQVRATSAHSDATISNNPLHATLASAWSARATLVYV